MGEYDDVPLEGLPPELQALLLEAFRHREARRASHPQRLEAQEWFSSNTHPHPLALNHFPSRREAEAFVHGLYTAGAISVIVDNIDYSDAGPRSDTIRVKLPESSELRRHIFELCNQHCLGPEETGNRFLDTGQWELCLWWD